MKIKVIGGIILGIFVLFTTYRFTYTHFEEKGRHQFEDGEYCESLENVKRAMYFSRVPAWLLASFYARGLCISQDVGMAKKIYQDKLSENQSELAEWLFYEGVEVAREDARNNTPNRIEKIRPLFFEAKKLGYSAGEKEIEELKQRNLQQLFNEIVIKN